VLRGQDAGWPEGRCVPIVGRDELQGADWTCSYTPTMFLALLVGPDHVIEMANPAYLV
jgi:hypothetical protein